MHVALQDQRGIRMKTDVFRRHVEKGNFIVLLRKNVLQDELPVIRLCVSMMVCVQVTRVVNVLTV